MYQGLLHLHSVLRWIILIYLVIAIYQAYTKNEGIKKTSLPLLIASHITLLIGLYQWITGPLGLKLLQAGGAMGDTASRFWAVEHMTGMIIAIILITIARGKAKVFNFKPAFALYLVALILILASIPWPFRAEIGRPFFPGM